MSWKLTARVVDEHGGYERVYTSDDADSPEFARGFVLGACAAHGIPPEQIELKWESGEE